MGEADVLVAAAENERNVSEELRFWTRPESNDDTRTYLGLAAEGRTALAMLEVCGALDEGWDQPELRSDDLAGTHPGSPRRAPGGAAPKNGVADSLGSIDPTKPDATGYVARPTDLGSYVPMAKVLAEYCEDTPVRTTKELTKILGAHGTNRVRWTRPLSKKTGVPNPQRRSVHLADWANYVERLQHQQPDNAEKGFPNLAPAEIEARKSKLRHTRRIGK